ncbi:SDR family NAD(P)-dependent oxidoreductase [Streptomyces sp. TE33382]
MAIAPWTGACRVVVNGVRAAAERVPPQGPEIADSQETWRTPVPGKVWLITGTSRGFGRVWAQAALVRGGRVACTARERFGRPDVVISNAGHGLFGPVEDVTEEQARAQFDTNFFGALWVTRQSCPAGTRQQAHPADVGHRRDSLLADAGPLPRLRVGP